MVTKMILFVVLLGSCAAVKDATTAKAQAQMAKESLQDSIDFEVKSDKRLKGIFQAPDSKTGDVFGFDLLEHPDAKIKEGQPLVTYKLSIKKAGTKEFKNVLEETFHPHWDSPFPSETRNLKAAHLQATVEDHEVHHPEDATTVNPKINLVHYESREMSKSDLNYAQLRKKLFTKADYAELALLSFGLIAHGCDALHYPISMWAHQNSITLAEIHEGDVDTKRFSDIQDLMFEDLIAPEEDESAKDGMVDDVLGAAGDDVLAALEEDEVVKEDHDILSDEASSELEMDSCVGYGRRRRNCHRRRRRRRTPSHCGNMKTNWIMDSDTTQCPCCPCCGRCGPKCTPWVVCAQSSDDNGWRKACWYHDLQCGMAVANNAFSGGFAAFMTCWALSWTAILGGYGWPPCGSSRTCTGGGHTSNGHCTGGNGGTNADTLFWTCQ